MVGVSAGSAFMMLKLRPVPLLPWHEPWRERQRRTAPTASKASFAFVPVMGQLEMKPTAQPILECVILSACHNAPTTVMGQGTKLDRWSGVERSGRRDRTIGATSDDYAQKTV